MSISLSSLVDNLSEIYKKQCKKCKERKKAISECKFFDIEGNKLSYTCKECNDKSHKSVNGLKEKFPNTYQFCNDHLDKFVSLLRKSVYPYEDMDRWEKFNEASLADKQFFYRKPNNEGISDEDYTHPQNVWEVLEIKDRGEYHDLYVQNNTLFLADGFENFRDKCIDIYGLDPAHFLSVTGLAW